MALFCVRLNNKCLISIAEEEEEAMKGAAGSMRILNTSYRTANKQNWHISQINQLLLIFHASPINYPVNKQCPIRFWSVRHRKPNGRTHGIMLTATPDFRYINIDLVDGRVSSSASCREHDTTTENSLIFVDHKSIFPRTTFRTDTFMVQGVRRFGRTDISIICVWVSFDFRK